MEGLRNLEVQEINALGPYGITQYKLDTFSEKNTQYDKSIGSPGRKFKRDISYDISFRFILVMVLLRFILY
ncbi:MAG TPA: hypothetical protein PKA90_16810 [Ignavibacteria bacterium]|nr:hypothetical protein [Ignavibacteria bacterium]HMR42079.1 hypothetical protein [Ignavibacteria bacterium]